MDAGSFPEPPARPAFEVRPARDSDCDAIWRVHCASIRVLCRERYRPHEIEAWIGVRSPQSYRQAIATRELFVAERNGEIAGFGQFDPEASEVEACYVAPEAVGSGIGAALLARMEEAARQRGHAIVRLNATLNAEAFYGRQGYRRLGLASHRVAGRVDLACIRMEKSIAR